MPYWLELNSGTCLHHWRLSTLGQTKSSRVPLDWLSQFCMHQNPAGVLLVVRGSSLSRPGSPASSSSKYRRRDQNNDQAYMRGPEMPLPKASWLDVSMIYFSKEDFVTLVALLFSAPDYCNRPRFLSSCRSRGANRTLEKLIFSSIIVSSFLYPLCFVHSFLIIINNLVFFDRYAFIYVLHLSIPKRLLTNLQSQT